MPAAPASVVALIRSSSCRTRIGRTRAQDERAVQSSATHVQAWGSAAKRRAQALLHGMMHLSPSGPEETERIGGTLLQPAAVLRLQLTQMWRACFVKTRWQMWPGMPSPSSISVTQVGALCRTQLQDSLAWRKEGRLNCANAFAPWVPSRLLIICHTSFGHLGGAQATTGLVRALLAQLWWCARYCTAHSAPDLRPSSSPIGPPLL